MTTIKLLQKQSVAVAIAQHKNDIAKQQSGSTGRYLTLH